MTYVREEFQRHRIDAEPVAVEDVAFHEHAVHTWRPGITTFPGAAQAAEAALVPDPLHRPWLVTAGEAFTVQQGWAEGALRSARSAIRHLLLLRRRSGGGGGSGTFRRARLNEMRFHAYAVRIPQQWFVNHPGGASPLLRHQGEDIATFYKDTAPRFWR